MIPAAARDWRPARLRAHRQPRNTAKLRRERLRSVSGRNKIIFI